MKNTLDMTHDQRMSLFGIRVYDAVKAWLDPDPGPLYTSEDLQLYLVAALKLEKKGLTVEDLLWIVPTIIHAEKLSKEAYEDTGRHIHEGY